MTLDEFWDIVEKVHNASGGDMDKKCKLLDQQLRQLSTDEIKSFHAHFTDCLDRAYSYETWAAAYIIGHGCSDDSFWDFRSTLISMGRSTYESAMADPQSLADMNYDADNAQWEGYQYVPSVVYRDITGTELPRSKPHPKNPTGYDWPEDKVGALYPKLAAKYSYKDPSR